jgi:hypothetical protein
MLGKTRAYTTCEENCAENVPGKFWIGSKLIVQGHLMVITHFGKSYVKDNHRVIDFHTMEIQAVPTTAEETKEGGTHEP